MRSYDGRPKADSSSVANSSYVLKFMVCYRVWREGKKGKKIVYVDGNNVIIDFSVNREILLARWNEMPAIFGQINLVTNHLNDDSVK